MYISKLTIENFRCFGEGADGLQLRLRPGLTALVGENEAGKTAVIDALRFIFGTTDQEWYRLEDTDFYRGDISKEIRIVCKFEDLSQTNKRALVEYLTYGEKEGDEPTFYIHWTAKDTGDGKSGTIIHGRISGYHELDPAATCLSSSAATTTPISTSAHVSM